MKNRIKNNGMSIAFAIITIILFAFAWVHAIRITSLELPETIAIEKGKSSQIELGYIFNYEDVSEEDIESTLKLLKLNWVSDNEEIATVDENGFVTAHKAGEANITVSSVFGKLSATCKLKVEVLATGINAPADMGFVINQDVIKKVGASIQPADATDVKLVYSSSDENIAKVNETGYVIGVGSGECVITTSVVSTKKPAAKYDLTTETKITVKTAPESIALADATITLGSTKKLGVVTVPAKVDLGNNYTWSSSDKNIVTVDEKGNIKGAALGTAKITVSNELGQVTECTITVKAIVCGYCNGTGHTSAYCAKKAVANGAIGRWVIPSVGVNVATYFSTEQAVCDAADSAAAFYRGSQILIADHAYQGFSAIKKCKVGTKAYMDTGNGRQEYVCTGVIQGLNYGTVSDENNVSIENRNPGGYTCYTCNDWSGVSITIVFFQPV